MKRGKKRFNWEDDTCFVDTKIVPEDSTIAAKVQSWETIYNTDQFVYNVWDFTLRVSDCEELVGVTHRR